MPAEATTTALLWEGRTPAARGPAATLSVDAIAAAGVAIADQHGIGAVSMQAVAESLGFTKMALYRHVRGKDELLAVMVEAAVEDVPELGRRRNWRAQLEAFASALADVWARHPWVPWVTRGRRQMGPREVAWVEAALQPLTRTRLTPTERLDAVFLLFGHLRNTHSLDTAGTQPWHEPALGERIRQHPEHYPALADMPADGVSADNGRSFGLARILDGIERLHESRA